MAVLSGRSPRQIVGSSLGRYSYGGVRGGVSVGPRAVTPQVAGAYVSTSDEVAGRVTAAGDDRRLR